jgi:hypothetical protein
MLDDPFSKQERYPIRTVPDLLGAGSEDNRGLYLNGKGPFAGHPWMPRKDDPTVKKHMP